MSIVFLNTNNGMKKILEGTKGKNYYGSTFVCLDRYHLMRESYGNKKSDTVKKESKRQH